MVVSLTEEDRVRGGSGPKRAKLRRHQTLKWRWLREMDLKSGVDQGGWREGKVA